MRRGKKTRRTPYAAGKKYHKLFPMNRKMKAGSDVEVFFIELHL
jgi:hypothetical protein